MKKGLLKALEENPKDVLTLFALADLAQEEGEELESEAWRYLGKKRKYPWRPSEVSSVSMWFSGKLDSYRHCQLPAYWLVLMEGKLEPNPEKQKFSFIQDAFLMAVKAYGELTEAQRKELWK